jgi:hypothetical protein
MTGVLPGLEYDCPECGTHIVLHARLCPGCSPLVHVNRRTSEGYGWLLLFLLLIFVIATLATVVTETLRPS